MRVLHVVPTYVPAWRYGGPIRSVHGLCKGLAARGVEVHVFTTNVDGDSVSDVPTDHPVDLDGVQVHYFPCGSVRRLYVSSAMRQALARSVAGFDLLHLHSCFLWPTWAAARRAEAARVPFVVAPRGALVPELIARRGRLRKSLWIRWIERRTLSRAAAIHVTSEWERLALSRLALETAPPFVVPNGIDRPPDPPANVPADREDGRRLVFLGRVQWEKGLDRLVPALAQLPGVELVLAGDADPDYADRLRALARDAGAADRMRLVGPVDGEEKWQLLRGADVVVLPSFSENFGMAALEGMAVGRPVAVTRGVGLASVVAEVEAGILLEEDPSGMARALAALLDDPARARKMGANGRRVAMQRFAWDRVAKAMESRYRDLVAAKPNVK